MVENFLAHSKMLNKQLPPIVQIKYKFKRKVPKIHKILHNSSSRIFKEKL